MDQKIAINGFRVDSPSIWKVTGSEDTKILMATKNLEKLHLIG